MLRRKNSPAVGLALFLALLTTSQSLAVTSSAAPALAQASAEATSSPNVILAQVPASDPKTANSLGGDIIVRWILVFLALLPLGFLLIRELLKKQQSESKAAKASTVAAPPVIPEATPGIPGAKASSSATVAAKSSSTADIATAATELARTAASGTTATKAKLAETATKTPVSTTAASVASIPGDSLVKGFPTGAAVAASAGIAGAAGAAAWATRSQQAQEEVEATKFDLGADDRGMDLADVDAGLTDLPAGYGVSRLILMPRDPQTAYAYWDAPNEHKEDLRRQGGQRLALRLYDVTRVDLEHQNPHSLQQYDVDELAQDWYLPIPVSDRDYLAEIGYLAADGRWLVLARSNPIHIPPVFPSDWYEDQFLTIAWDEALQGKTFATLVPPGMHTSFGNPIYDQLFGMAKTTEAMRVAGSLFGSMQHVPGSVPGSAQMMESPSSYTLASGAGLAAGLTMSGAGLTMSGAGLTMSGAGLTMSGAGLTMFGAGLTMSGAGLTMSGAGLTMSGAGLTMSGAGLTMSGAGFTMSGIGMSGVGFSASMPPIRARKFWLIGDAELIIYGATEPDATVTIAGRPVQLNPDGTFRFQMSFQDGVIDFPILAVAVDGVQTRAIHMKFDRETPLRHTNTKDEARDQPF